MEKKKEKQNVKPVGAGLVPAQNKGITLIALIITIIVMLILVGVTINVAINGGLFEKAETATKQTQIEAEKEELLSAVVAAIGTDAKVDFDYLDDNLPNNWDGEDGTYTSPKGNTYTVDKNGKIEEGSKPKEEGNDAIIQILNDHYAEKISVTETVQQLKHELSIENENDRWFNIYVEGMDENEEYLYVYIYKTDEMYVTNFDNINFSYVNEKEDTAEQYNFFRNVKTIKEELENIFVGTTVTEMQQKYNEGTLDEYVLDSSEKISAIEFREIASYIGIRFVTLSNDSNEFTLSYNEHNYTVNIEYENESYSNVYIAFGS